MAFLVQQIVCEKKVKRDKVDAQLSQAAKRVAQTQAELADAKELLNAAQSYNREMSAKLAQLEAQRSAAVDAQQALQTEVERLEQTTVTRQELAEATRAELAVAQKRVAALESTVAAERQRLATLQAECNALKRQIAAAKVGGQGPMAPAAE